jgi:L-alanine-DL-glutamate epimerase-like enolase superfamily enzyme
MKITKIESIPLNTTLSRIFRGGNYQHDRRGVILTTIHTDEGITGQAIQGQNRYQINEQRIMSKIINDKFSPELVGEDPFTVEYLWKKMFSHTAPRKNRILVWESIACVDITLYDLMGKALGVPVYKLLGGYRDEVPLISVQYYRAHDDYAQQLTELREDTAEAKKLGFYGIKLKVGAPEIDQDVERVRTVREEGGDDFLICCDANQSWSPGQAIEFGKKVEQHNLAYLEEPVQWQDEKRGLRKVREALDIPICACQSLATMSECLEYILDGSVDMINHDVSRVGGITEWMKIAHIADAHGVKITAHANIESTLPLFGATPNSTWATQQTPDRDPFWSGGRLMKETPRPKNGCVKLSDRPGLGYEVKKEAIEEFRVPLE